MRFCEAPNCDAPVFGSCKKSRKGYCKKHQYLREDYDRRSILQKAVANKEQRLGGKIRNIGYDKVAGDKHDNQERWFKNIATEYGFPNGCACWECGTWIPFTFMRAATAHIFPKKTFGSVSTHPENFLILGAGCGCHDKTHRMDTFSKMRVFPEAVKRFKSFEAEIKETNKYLDLFKQYANG